MKSVTFEFAEQHGRFQCHRADGTELVVKAGKPYTTDDPAEIAMLGETSYVKRTASAKRKPKSKAKPTPASEEA